MIAGSVFSSAALRRNPLLRFLANVLRCLWLFFPSLLFIGLALLCFTQLAQGKDILITFTETPEKFGSSLLTRFIFLLAITFWVYVSWYASRMVAYIKSSQHYQLCRNINPQLSEPEYEQMFDMELRFLHRFPRIIGYACLLVIVIGLTMLVTRNEWLRDQPFVFLLAGMLVLWVIDRRMIRISTSGQASRKLKWLLVTAAIILPLLVIGFTSAGLFSDPRYTILLLLVLLVVYMLYINLRRHHLEAKHRESLAITQVSPFGWKRRLGRMMDWMHLPREERSYFAGFNLICAIGLGAYIAAVFHLGASTGFGPFPVILLAFAVLAGFGNIITALSCKYSLNIHFFIFAFAAFLPTPDHHRVRMGELSTRRVADTVYRERQQLSEYLHHWLENRPELDTASSYPMYFVLANGGASRSAYWVAGVLGRLEDASISKGGSRFSRHVFCLSGTSGGGVGIATFYAQLLNQGDSLVKPAFEQSGRAFLRQDFLSFVLARMLGPDFFNYIPLINLVIPDEDRAEALEQAFERALDTSYYKTAFDRTWFDQCITRKGRPHAYPILMINTTRVKDGNPGLVSTIQLATNIFNRRVDLLGMLPRNQTLRLSTAAILGARFPYISPAGRIDAYKPPSREGATDTIRANYFVDGGYFDNSGAGSVQEMIRGILKIGANMKDETLKKRLSRVSINVIHITNSPQGSVPLRPIGPFVNDLLSPLLTITGAYDMQTTVNDRRFMTYIQDISEQPAALGIRSAAYIPIHLYNDPQVAGDTLSRGPYAMNWFISDSVRNQMDRRLGTQPRLKELLGNGR